MRCSPRWPALKLAPHKPDPSAEAFRGRYACQMAEIRARLRLPEASELYSPDEVRLNQRPRLHFGPLTLAGLRQRAADPRFAALVARVHALAARYAGSTPPATVQIREHDPNRAFADSLPWMAMSVLLDGDEARRQGTLAGLSRWMAAMLAWGPFENNLPLAQSIISLSIVYDWLHEILPGAELASLRNQLITWVRTGLDENRGGLTMWRGQRFAANHNWAHHSARAFAALALWGDTSAGLAPGELRSWLDDALVDFTIVRHTHASDGAPMEGPTYQDYGLRFYVDFCVQAETLLQVRESFFDEHIRALSGRLFTLLPGHRSSMVYADGGSTEWWDSCSHFRRLASHFRDGRFQLLGEVLAESGSANALPSWRDLFGYDPELAPARLAELPLFHDFTDFGLYTARSDWGADAAFFGLRCGPASATSVVEQFGFDFGEAHVYPNQGDFTFYQWGQPVIPGCGYAHTKVTTNHNLVVVEGRASQAGRMVGQVGEGGPWFNAAAPTDPDADYDRRDRAPTVTHVRHTAGFHHYLCDLGGLYRLRDERVPSGVFFPGYHRSLVFLPDGAVAIVDRIQAPEPRTFCFRLLTAVENLEADAGGFSCTVARVPARINDFSPARFVRQVATETLTTREFIHPAVASLRAEAVREAVFAVVIGVGPAADRYRIAPDARGYALTTAEGNPLLRVDWPIAG